MLSYSSCQGQGLQQLSLKNITEGTCFVDLIKLIDSSCDQTDFPLWALESSQAPVCPEQKGPRALFFCPTSLPEPKPWLSVRQDALDRNNPPPPQQRQLRERKMRLKRRGGKAHFPDCVTGTVGWRSDFLKNIPSSHSVRFPSVRPQLLPRWQDMD